MNRTRSTHGSVIGKRNSMFQFHCSFTLAPSPKDIFGSLSCGYTDSNTNDFIILANQNQSPQLQAAPSIPTSYLGRIKTYPSNYTFAIERLEFSDQKSYKCVFKWQSRVFDNDPTYIDSSYTFGPADLEVQGKKDFMLASLFYFCGASLHLWRICTGIWQKVL